MEINQELLYIIIGIFYFLYNVWKNFSKKPVTREEQEVQEEPKTAEKRPHRRETVSNPFDESVGRPIQRQPSSFEELLQEFEEVSQSARRKAEEKVKKVQEVDEEYEPVFDDPDIRYNEYEAERQMRETEARKALLEKTSAAERAKAVGEEFHRKIQEEGPLLGTEENGAGRKKYAAPNNRRRQQILDMLKKPGSVANAVIVSEILKRKHF